MAKAKVHTWYEVACTRGTASFPTLKAARVFKLIHGGTIYECTSKEVVKKTRKPVVSKA